MPPPAGGAGEQPLKSLSIGDTNMNNSPSGSPQEEASNENARYGWECMEKVGGKVIAVHTSVRTFDDYDLAKRAMRNHTKQHKECRKGRQRVVELDGRPVPFVEYVKPDVPGFKEATV